MQGRASLHAEHGSEWKLRLRLGQTSRGSWGKKGFLSGGALKVKEAQDRQDLGLRLTAAVDRIRPRLKRLLKRFRVPPQDGEDILQEVFLATLVAMRRYGDRWKIQDLEGWIYNTTKYRSVVYARRRQWQWRRLSSIEEVVRNEELHSSWNPERVVTALDVLRGVSELGTKVGRLVEMRVMGYTPAEIAESLGYSETSVRKVWSRALAKLRSAASQEGSEAWRSLRRLGQATPDGEGELFEVALVSGLKGSFELAVGDEDREREVIGSEEDDGEIVRRDPGGSGGVPVI
jgi:RNA polymerase sigma factor (sigma-70 family)